MKITSKLSGTMIDFAISGLIIWDIVKVDSEKKE